VVEETVSRTEVGVVHDNHDGTYLVSYSSVKSGEFDLQVRLKPFVDLGLLAAYFDNNMLVGEPMEVTPRLNDGVVSEYALSTNTRLENPPSFGSFTEEYHNNFADEYNFNSRMVGGADDIRRLAPINGVPKAARWIGYVSVPISESYVFSLRSSEGSGVGGRLWVNGILAVSIESFTGASNEERTSDPILLQEGSLYDLVIEAFEVIDSLEVWWQSDRTQLQQIPRYHYHPPTVVTDASKVKRNIPDDSHLMSCFSWLFVKFDSDKTQLHTTIHQKRLKSTQKRRRQ
jgi:hypothetical protein